MEAKNAEVIGAVPARKERYREPCGTSSRTFDLIIIDPDFRDSCPRHYCCIAILGDFFFYVS